MPTDTFAITADSNDAWGRRSTGGAWSGIGSAAYTDGDSIDANVMGLSKAWNGSVFFSSCVYLRWDTSSLANDITITSANLLIYALDKSGVNESDYAADFYDFSGEPSDASDHEVSSSGDAISTITRASITTGAVNTIPLTGLSGISVTGFTGIRLGAKTATEPTVDDWIDFAPFTAAEQEARLEVTYNLGPALISRMSAKDFPKPKLRTVA